MLTPATADAPPPTSATVLAKQGRVAVEFEALDTCHQQVLETLDVLARMIELLERNGVDSEVSALARQVHDFFGGTAHQHHVDEERLVFPPLLESGDEVLAGYVRRLKQDHFWLERDWRELDTQIDAIARGLSPNDPEALRLGVEIINALYLDHIDLEESLIYPQAKRRLSERANAGAARLLAEERHTKR